MKSFTRCQTTLPHGILAAGGAFVPTQEKKKDLKTKRAFKAQKTTTHF